MPQIFWIKRARKNIWISLFVMIIINTNHWMYLLTLKVTSSHRSYIPVGSSYDLFSWDSIAPMIASILFYVTLIFIIYKITIIFIKRKNNLKTVN